MMNDNKYGRLYPERAVAPLLDLARQAEKGEHIRAAEWSDVLRSLSVDGFPEDEPLFLLRGQDMLAAQAVRRYFDSARDTGLQFNEKHAAEHVAVMAAWQPRKMPD